MQVLPGGQVDPARLIDFVKSQLGSVKAPKAIHVWSDLPRSKVGKVLKVDIKNSLAAQTPR